MTGNAPKGMHTQWWVLWSGSKTDMTAPSAARGACATKVLVTIFSSVKSQWGSCSTTNAVPIRACVRLTLLNIAGETLCPRFLMTISKKALVKICVRQSSDKPSCCTRQTCHPEPLSFLATCEMLEQLLLALLMLKLLLPHKKSCTESRRSGGTKPIVIIPGLQHQFSGAQCVRPVNGQFAWNSGNGSKFKSCDANIFWISCFGTHSCFGKWMSSHLSRSCKCNTANSDVSSSVAMQNPVKGMMLQSGSDTILILFISPNFICLWRLTRAFLSLSLGSPFLRLDSLVHQGMRADMMKVFFWKPLEDEQMKQQQQQAEEADSVGGSWKWCLRSGWQHLTWNFTQEKDTSDENSDASIENVSVMEFCGSTMQQTRNAGRHKLPCPGHISGQQQLEGAIAWKLPGDEFWMGTCFSNRPHMKPHLRNHTLSWEIN